MVVFGHCFLGLKRVDFIPAEELWHGILRGFVHPLAMPIFFVLSGMFSVRLAERPWRAVLANRAGGLAYPYVVWVLIHGSILALASGLANNTATISDFTNMWFQPPYHFWFLYALFFISLLYVALRKAGLPSGLIFFLAAVLYVTIPFMGFTSWPGAYLTRQHLPCFALGAWLGYQAIDARLNRAEARTLALAALAGIGATAVFAAVFQQRPGPYLTVLVFAVGGTGFLALAALMSRVRGFGAVELWGRRSLEIYLAHAVFVAGMRIVLMRLGVEHWFPHIVLGTAVGLYGPIILVQMSERFGFTFLFSLKSRSATSVAPAPAPVPQRAAVPLESETPARSRDVHASLR